MVGNREVNFWFARDSFPICSKYNGIIMFCPHPKSRADKFPTGFKESMAPDKRCANYSSGAG